ncbi:S-adenosyl-L-methionine-dependent methyltransferase [Gonapodya prolifera JEL478]|uniref:S-adenosyl-L-methionine-dependent methyltransferase n=1 Tax=Gonapodya prolifera (strain JEL478) TaxID=1344416 RepID=A0A139AIF1_GONPJ|nr:S-adenosyl-L-methionine-dependent methyltransferase [Gonapodya prolifera JEL478]|eukprot:KXS16591.1 S-adenosyl-L-methionine-dependent methyltransferase [Gonapodya prolifera JEL478]
MADFHPSPPPADLKPRISASYDAIALAYNSWTAKHNQFRNRYLAKLFGLCPALTATAPESGSSTTTSAAVVELGCGSGVPILREVLAANPTTHATGIDISTAQIALAAENLSAYVTENRVILRVADMASEQDVSFPDESLDAVIALWSIIHLPQDEQREVIARAARWLKSGGCMLVNFGGGPSMEGIVVEKWLGEKGWMFWSSLGDDGYTRALKQACMKVVVADTVEEGTGSFFWVIAMKQ